MQQTATTLDTAQLRRWLARAAECLERVALDTATPDLRVLGAVGLVRQCIETIDEQELTR